MDAFKPDAIALIVEDHRRIKDLTTALLGATRALDPPDHFQTWQLSLLRRLREFQHVLLNHFDLEEIGGFTEDLRERAPHLMHRVGRLEEEHGHLEDLLEAIIGALKDMRRFIPDRVEDIFEQTRDVILLLREHEAAETALLQEVYYQDVGVRD